MLAVVSVKTGVAAMEWIAGWGALSITCAVLGFIFASQKNRDASSWAAWCFLFPPLVLWIMLIGRNTGQRPPRKPIDDLDRNGIL